MKKLSKCQEIISKQHEICFYYQNYYKLIGIDISKQANTSIPQQINFVGKLEEDNGAIMFLLLKSSKKLF